LTAGFISGVGDWFNTVAVLSVVLSLTGSGIAVGFTLALRVLPRLVLGPVAGVLADHLPRKTILVLADAASAVLALSMLLVTSPERVWLVYAATAAMVASSILHGPARSAAIPSLVRPENLLAANALDSSAQGLVMVAGAVLGGLVAAALGAPVAFLLNALSFALSALVTLPIHFPSLPPGRPRLTSLAALWPLVRGSRLISVFLLLAVLWPLGGGAVNVLISVYAVQVFRAGDFGVGLFYGSIGVGLLLGGLVTHHVARWERSAPILAFALEGMGHMLVSQAPSLWIAAGALTVTTAGAGVGNASMSALIMRRVPNPMLGRFFALEGTLSAVTFSLSLLLSGLLVTVVSPRTLGLCAGALIVAAAAVSGALLRGAKVPLAVQAL